MERSIISTKNAPAAIGPYVQANKVGDFIFTSGQIPLDPETGEIKAVTFEDQAVRVFKNLQAVLEAAGSGLDSVIKTTVYLTNIGDFAKMNEIYAEFFNGPMLPSRTAIEVSHLPKDVLVEAEVIAITSMV